MSHLTTDTMRVLKNCDYDKILLVERYIYNKLEEDDCYVSDIIAHIESEMEQNQNMNTEENQYRMVLIKKIREEIKEYRTYLRERENIILNEKTPGTSISRISNGIW